MISPFWVLRHNTNIHTHNYPRAQPVPCHGQVPSLRFSLRCGVKFGGPTQSAFYGAWCSGCLDYMKTDILIIRSKWHDKWAWPAFYFCFSPFLLTPQGFYFTSFRHTDGRFFFWVRV